MRKHCDTEILMGARNEKRCLIVGEGTLPLACMDILLESGFEVVAIVSKDPRVAMWASEKRIDLFSDAEEFQGKCQNIIYDYLFSIVNPYRLNCQMIENARVMAVNYHDAPLPKYAGTYATSWALIDGNMTHAVTWHMMAAMVDAGDVLIQEKISVSDDDTALTLNMKCYESAQNTFRRLIESILIGNVVRLPQDLGKRTFFKRTRRPSAGCILQWNRDAKSLADLVRALEFGPYLNPLGRPKILVDDEVVAISSLKILPDRSRNVPGTIVGFDCDSMIVTTASNDVKISKFSDLYGKEMSLPDLLESKGIRTDGRLRILNEIEAERILSLNERMASKEEYWVRRLEEAEPTVLPYSMNSCNGIGELCTIVTEIDPYLVEEARTAGIRGREAVICAFLFYLMRLTDRRSVTVGAVVEAGDLSSVSIRNFFARAVPLHVEVGADVCIDDALCNALTELNEMRAHGTYSNDVFSRYPSLRNDGGGLSAGFPIVVNASTACQPMLASDVMGSETSLVFEVSEDGSSCRWIYNPLRIGKNEIRKLSDEYISFLQNCAASPATPILQVPILGKEEHLRVMTHWNQTACPLPDIRLLHKLFDRQATLHPDAEAISASGIQLTYEELKARAMQLALKLIENGASRNKLVAVLMEKGWEQAVATLAIMYSGAAYLPLEPDTPPARLNYIFEQAEVNIVLTQSRSMARCVLPDSVRCRICVDQLGDEHCIPELPYVHCDPDDLAYVIYTSGSTGSPKGVAISHLGAVNTIVDINRRFTVTASDRVLALSSLSFDLSVFDFFGTFAAGGTLVIPDSSSERDPEYLINLVRKEKISIWNSVPALANILIDQLQGDIELESSLRLFLLSGDWIPLSLPEKVKKYFAKAAVISLGGATEASIWSIFYPIRSVDPAWKSIPYGMPLSNQSFYILDSALQPVPFGVPGHLFIGGLGVAKGYWKDAEKTRNSFICHPCLNEIIYKTGDIGRYMPDGNIEFLGRADTQVKIRGYRIELGEIEAVLSKCPEVHQAVVIVREDSPGDKRLVAYLNLCPGRGISDLEGIKQQLKSALPYYMMPMHFMLLNSLPVTTNGKINRRALPAPEKNASDINDEGNKSDTEHALSEIWKDVLRLSHVGLDDNFFSLGGDSIQSIQIVSRARKKGMEISNRQILEYQTIKALAEHIKTTNVSVQSRIASKSEGEVDLLPVQRWFFEHSDFVDYFNQSTLLHVPDDFDADMLPRIIEAIWVTHDVTRLRFYRDGGDWKARFACDDHVAKSCIVSYEDMRHLRQEHFESVLAERLLDAQAGMSITHGPVFKAALFKAGTGMSRLLLVAHHLIVDGVSWRIILGNIEEGYRQIKEGRETISLQKPQAGCQQWSRHLRRHAQTVMARAHWSYWAEVARAEAQALPLDNVEAGNGLIEDAEILRVSLAPEETELLIGECNHRYRTKTGDLLLTSLSFALKSWKGIGKIKIDLEGHGREEIGQNFDIGDAVGWFTSIYPVVIGMPESGGIGELIVAVKERLRSLPENGLSYGLLRYLTENSPEDQENLRYSAPLIFNYLGQLDSNLQGEAGGFRVSETAAKLFEHPKQKRRHQLDITCFIVEKRLHMQIAYSRKQFLDKTIEHLGDSIEAALFQVIHHCRAEHGISVKNTSFRELVSGTGPLTPNNHWFLQRKVPNHWNASFLLEVDNSFGKSVVREAISCILEHHDALRTRWEKVGTGWVHRYLLPHEMSPWWDVVDLRHLPDKEAVEKIESTCAAAQETLDIKNVLFKVLYFDLGDKRPARVMFVIHHVLFDAYSHTIFMEDFQNACQSIAVGVSPQFSSKTTSLKLLSYYLAEYADSMTVKRSLQYWVERPWERYAPLPTEDTKKLVADDGIAHVATIQRILSRERVEQIEGIVRSLPGITLEYMLMAAVVLAYHRWAGGALLLNSVYHGRNPNIGDRLDLSRTIGWISGYSNCFFDIDGKDKPSEILYAVKNQFEQVKGREDDYTLLKHMCSDQAIRERMQAFPTHQLEFNYSPLKAIDTDETGNKIRYAKENCGSDDGPMHSRFSPFCMVSKNAGRGLTISWSYCQCMYTEEYFERFVEMNIEALDYLISAYPSHDFGNVGSSDLGRLVELTS